MKTLFTALIIILFSLCGYSQDTLQTVRGRVSSATSGKALQAACVSFEGISNYHFYSDSAGYYSGKVAAGNYRVKVLHSGSAAQTYPSVVVLSGKQLVQDFELPELKVELDSVQVVATAAAENGISLDMWGLQRSAAVFYDPARMSTSYAAVINTDDQANNVSIHGTSPNYVQWQLEGVEIVSPNHLENAGTINDKPSFNGGGVSMLSAQVLQNSTFRLSPFELSSGNALTGIFDIKLRNGNNEKYERIIQASFLGTDLSMEGPLSAKGKASFLVNYRYSTVGLLSLLGVNFGGDRINYQDLSALLTVPLKNGQLKLFSIAGSSSTVFRASSDTLEYQQVKDLQNIDYHSFTNINGANFLSSISNTLLWRTVVAYSVKSTGRYSRSAGYLPLNIPEEKDQYQQQKLSTTNYISKRLGNSLRLKAGVTINYFTGGAHSGINEHYFVSGEINELLVQPFAALEGTFFRKLDYKLGMNMFCQTRINVNKLHPQASISWNISKEQYLKLSYGSSSQLQPFYLYLGNTENRDLLPTSSSSVSLTHYLAYRGIEFKNVLFMQEFTQVPVNTAMHFSAYNYFNEQISFPLESSGRARTYGYDLSIEKNFRTLYIITSASIFKSTYTDGTVGSDGRFGANYNFALTTGKEYTFGNKNKIFSTDLRFFIRDGFLEPAQQDEYFYTQRLAQYYRLDLRFSYRKNKRKSSVIWALDLQNALNHRNTASHYYDPYTLRTETRYQLGLIPVLSYKVLF
ncbi:MAG: TonB-dependent receptor plug [Bacteroidetes bacterium]|nr:TonB-dependent receptor plug [Bacteroidota bacterium]